MKIWHRALHPPGIVELRMANSGSYQKLAIATCATSTFTISVLLPVSVQFDSIRLLPLLLLSAIRPSDHTSRVAFQVCF